MKKDETISVLFFTLTSHLYKFSFSKRTKIIIYLFLNLK